MRSRQFVSERLFGDPFASLRGWQRRPLSDLRQSPPRAPVRCDRHGEDTVDITTWGQAPGDGIVCVFCMGDPRADADTLHSQAVERYERERAEYDALTVRVDEIERELRASRVEVAEPADLASACPVGAKRP